MAKRQLKDIADSEKLHRSLQALIDGDADVAVIARAKLIAEQRRAEATLTQLSLPADENAATRMLERFRASHLQSEYEALLILSREKDAPAHSPRPYMRCIAMLAA